MKYVKDKVNVVDKCMSTCCGSPVSPASSPPSPGSSPYASSMALSMSSPMSSTPASSLLPLLLPDALSAERDILDSNNYKLFISITLSFLHLRCQLGSVQHYKVLDAHLEESLVLLVRVVLEGQLVHRGPLLVEV